MRLSGVTTGRSSVKGLYVLQRVGTLSCEEQAFGLGVALAAELFLFCTLKVWDGLTSVAQGVEC